MNKFTKYIGFCLIILGGFNIFIYHLVAAEIPLLVGLFMVFISKQNREDERVVTIRSSSAYIALIIGYAIKLLLTNFYSHQIISFELVSINYFLIIVFSLANIIKYLRLYIFMA
jgi:hypothetical protein